MAPKFKYQEGETVLCYHGPLIYVAKVLSAEMRDKVPKYLVHYNGWNTRWDDWVPDSRILKHNEEGLQRQAELQKTYGKSRKRRGGAGSTAGNVPGTAVGSPLAASDTDSNADGSAIGTLDGALAALSASAAAAKRKKSRGPDKTVETENDFIEKECVRVRIPDELKPWLVDDWDLVTRQCKLIHIPARVPVEKILSDYVHFRESRGAHSTSSTDPPNEVIAALKDYFDAMLGSQLLYKFERGQYGEAMQRHKGKKPSDLYGASHLLRLTTRVGGMLAKTSLDDKTCSNVIAHIHDLLKYLSKHAGTLLTDSDYSTASPEYQRKVFAQN